MGLQTWAPLEWGSKRHGATSRNTTEAEITATSDATFRVGVPIQTFLERLLDRAVRLVAMQNNAACVIDVKRGYSRKMAHLPRHQNVSLGSLHERLVEDPAGAISQIPTKRQLADLLTKGLDHTAHWVLVYMTGMSSGADARR